MFGIKLNTNMRDFHPLGVVGRGSETQRQAGENLKNGKGLKFAFARHVAITRRGHACNMSLHHNK